MKNLLLVITLFTCFACNSTEKTSTSANPHEAFIKQYYAYFNQHDWQKMAAMYADTADFKDPSLGQSIVKQTHEQTIKKYSELSQAFPDLKDSVTNIYPAGEKHIVVEFISKGTAPDKSAFVLPICTIFTIENGVITKDFTYYDNF
ncbi:nuclear transport factor 2 family protein [Arcicella rosea]|uniref:SnoaL-like domain-containing protein n=1 Tax=Arcicella rosea TaxID=502909 RepID=A0A841EL47_9BACT|nr:nuclear transport factor 2 family protein [Arcicella rosea]MBB6004332.1 hypothetical protein [Arcicella rosea]